VARRTHTSFAAGPAAPAVTVLIDASLAPEPRTSATDHLLPSPSPTGVAPVGVAAHPRQRAGLPAIVAPVLRPLSTGTGAAVAIDRAG
jgi:hypothetical protein